MEYWQDILDRTNATAAVWQDFFPTLELGAVGIAEFTGLGTALPGLALTRDAKLQAVDTAGQARDFSWEELRLISLKVPKIIDGVLDSTSGVLDDLDKVYAVKPYSPETTLKRSGLLGPVWAAANTWQAGQVPPLAPIIRLGVNQAAFMSKIAAFYPLDKALTEQELRLDEARRALRDAARKLEMLCIRFLTAAKGTADPGSAAEQALASIPTTSVSPLPETLGIRTFAQGGSAGLQLLIAYEAYSLEPDETAKLEWMILDTDAGFSRSVPYDASGSAIGPFQVGQTVRIRSSVTNPSGTRTGSVRQLTLIAPPQ